MQRRPAKPADLRYDPEKRMFSEKIMLKQAAKANAISI